jgi:hypothetical protein
MTFLSVEAAIAIALGIEIRSRGKARCGILERFYRLSRGLVQIIARIQGAGRIFLCYLGGERAQHRRRQRTNLGGRQVGNWRTLTFSEPDSPHRLAQRTARSAIDGLY